LCSDCMTEVMQPNGIPVLAPTETLNCIELALAGRVQKPVRLSHNSRARHPGGSEPVERPLGVSWRTWPPLSTSLRKRNSEH
jgi:hypothetical protein